jgi:hypothetical protein
VSGQPITSIPNPYGQTGSSLAQSPPFQGSIRARYEVSFGDYTGFVQVAASHQAHSYSATGNIVVYDQPSYTIYDASLGVAKNAWNVQAYAQNLTDARADLFSNDNQFVQAETVNRPRTVGVRLGYKF